MKAAENKFRFIFTYFKNKNIQKKDSSDARFLGKKENQECQNGYFIRSVLIVLSWIVLSLMTLRKGLRCFARQLLKEKMTWNFSIVLIVLSTIVLLILTAPSKAGCLLGRWNCFLNPDRSQTISENYPLPTAVSPVFVSQTQASPQEMLSDSLTSTVVQYPNNAVVRPTLISSVPVRSTVQYSSGGAIRPVRYSDPEYSVRYSDPEYSVRYSGRNSLVSAACLPCTAISERISERINDEFALAAGGSEISDNYSFQEQITENICQPIVAYKTVRTTEYREEEQTRYKTVWVEEPRVRKYTVSRQIPETSVKKERVIVNRPVWETVEKEVSYNVTRYVPETTEREERKIVRRPITEMQSREIVQTVNRPVQQTVYQQRQYVVNRPVTSLQTKWEDVGGYVTKNVPIPPKTYVKLTWQSGGTYLDPATGVSKYQRPGLYWTELTGPERIRTEQVYQSQMVARQVPVTTYVPETVTESIPVNITSYQTEQVVRTVEFPVTTFVQEEQVSKIPVTTYRPAVEQIIEKIPQRVQRIVQEEQIREIPITTYRTVSEEIEEPYTVRVAKKIPEVEKILVPVTVIKKVPVAFINGRWENISVQETSGAVSVDDTITVEEKVFLENQKKRNPERMNYEQNNQEQELQTFKNESKIENSLNNNGSGNYKNDKYIDKGVQIENSLNNKSNKNQLSDHKNEDDDVRGQKFRLSEDGNRLEDSQNENENEHSNDNQKEKSRPVFNATESSEGTENRNSVRPTLNFSESDRNLSETDRNPSGIVSEKSGPVSLQNPEQTR